MSLILAIDPGTTQSGWCRFEKQSLVSRGHRTYRVIDSGVLDNNALLLDFVKFYHRDDKYLLAMEMIASMGMAVGQTTFDTVRWIGRFQQAWYAPDEVRLIYRRDIKLHLCGSMQAKDPNVRQALIDKIGAPGTKKKPGPTYGVASHAWSALAVAVTAAETVPIFEGAIDE